jgi:drug/metabolite transporter (DMT)-like permease
VHYDNKTGSFELIVSGSTENRLQFADFIDFLDRQQWTESVQTLISMRQSMTLVCSFCLAFAVIVLDIVLFPQYQRTISTLPLGLKLVVQALPLIPILGVNSYLLRLFRQYLARMQSERWFLRVGLLLNILGLFLLLLRMVLTEGFRQSLLPVIAIFTLSLGYVAYTFLKADSFFSPFDDRALRPVSQPQWMLLRSRKFAGYAIRLFAVLLWGLEPIYIKYTSANDLSPFLRTFLLSIGVLIPFGMFYVLRSLLLFRKLPRWFLPYDPSFIAIVIGQVGLMYFKNASLEYTSGTNLLLFNTFSPLLGLIVAAALWRREIPYFRRPQTMLSIFLIGAAASIGGSLLVGAESVVGPSWSLFGDILAIISTFFDVILTVGQIQYIKRFVRTDGMLLNLHIFFYLVLFTAPVLALSRFFGGPFLQNTSWTTLILGLGIGLFVGIGQMLNYEAFKRIDGYLAYMMFNLSVLITFCIEAFVLHSVQPTPLLIISAALIVGASVFAERINSRCERSGR